MYYFGDNSSPLKSYLQENTRSGMFVTNDVSFQFINHNLPFGGVGDSGYGTTKGIHGFNQLSLLRSVTERPNNTLGDIPLRYNTDTDPRWKLKWVYRLAPFLPYSPSKILEFLWRLIWNLFLLYLVYLAWTMDFVRFPAVEKYFAGNS